MDGYLDLITCGISTLLCCLSMQEVCLSFDLSCVVCRHVKAETGSLVFGVFKAVFSGILTILFGVGLFLEDFSDWEGEFEFNHHKLYVNSRLLLALKVYLGLLLLKTCADFLFAAFLCEGLMKKKAGYVKAYFIYGSVNAFILGVLAFACFFVDITCALILCAVFMIYVPILWMVRNAFINISTADAEEPLQFQYKVFEKTESV